MPLTDLGPPGPVLGIKVYRVGTWNGIPTTPAEMRELAVNFTLFSKPLDTAEAFFVPPVSLFHDKTLAFGHVTRCDPEDDHLDIDLDGVPLVIRLWMKESRLTFPSVEVWNPGTFAGPHGVKWPTHVLGCVTLLGAEPPGVKGLPPLSAAKFPGLNDGFTVPSGLVTSVGSVDEASLRKYRDHADSVRKYRDNPPPSPTGAKAMDERNQIIKAMSDMEFDTKTITDAVPLETLKAMRDTLQKSFADVKKYKDEAAKRGEGDKTKPDPEDDAEVKKYRDRLAAVTADSEKVLATLRQQAEAGAAATKASIDAIRDARIKAFRDEMVGPNAAKVAYMTPHQFDTLAGPLLTTLDCQTVRKYADGKTDGTALDEQIARIKAAHPTPIKSFSDKLNDGQGIGGGPAKMTPERRAELLSKTPEGQAILAREKAAAK